MTDNRKGISAATVGIGLAGAVAGAAAGVALSDEKNRKKLLALAKDAHLALQKLMDNLEEVKVPEVKELPEKARKVVKQVKDEVKAIQKDRNS